MKINDKFFFKFKKPYFWTISQVFGAKCFSKKSGCHAQLHQGSWHHAKIQRNLMIQFPEYTQVVSNKIRFKKKNYKQK